MTSYTISPVWGAGAQLFDNNGDPLSGGKLYTYYAGTTTPAATYTDPLGANANANPITANSAGRLVNEIWLPVTGAFKFILKDANDVLLATYDNIPSSPQPPVTNDASSISYEQGYEVNAGSFTVGAMYRITEVGTTDFVAIGAASNTVGVLFTATTGGSGTGKAAFSRYVQTRLQDFVTLKDFGAVGDGVTDDTAAVAAAEASSYDRIYVPEGRYLTTYTNTNTLSKVYYGDGQLIIGGYATARVYSNVNTLLPTLPFNQFAALDDNQIPVTSFRTVTANVNPSPLPTTYTNYNQYAQEIGFLQYSAGFNTDPADHTKGRSGARHRMDFVYHAGQGDLTNRGFFGSVSSSRSGATHFLANPAIIVENGNIGAQVGATGAYLNHSEYIFSDNGVAVAAINSVRNYIRTNDGSTLSQVWLHDRPQSNGSKPIDAVYSVAGKMKVGLDFTPATLEADKVAIALKNNDRIYLNASSTPDSLGARWCATSPGDMYIAGINGFFTVNIEGAAKLQVSKTDAIISTTNGVLMLSTGILRFNGTGQHSTGVATAVFTPTNKPGGTSGQNPSTWLQIELNNSSYVIPCWAL